MLRLSASLICVLTTALLLALSSCAVNPVTGKKELMLLSKDQEVAMGIQYNPEIIAAFGSYNDEALQNFITQKGTEMARVSHRPELDYKFQILDSPVVNAFAVPGGYVYFTRGILAHFNNEAEFAGVLGHEIGHITARHSARQYSSQILMQGALLLGVVVSNDFAQYADVASQGLGLLMLKFGRDHETQSDQLGVEYSTKIGYDAREMANFFNTIRRLSGDGGSVPTFLSTHPDPTDRNQKVYQLANKWQQKQPSAQFKVNRETYLRMIDGLVYGEDPRQGYLDNWTFYHPELKFQFPVPRDWQYENTPAQVQMAPRDGKALLLLTIAPHRSLTDAANAIAQDTSRRVQNRQNTTVNGLPATVLLTDQRTQDGNTVRGLIYLIQYNDLIYKMKGLSYANDFNAWRNIFENSMSNFRPLTDSARLNAAPERIRIKTVERDATLEQTLRGFGMPDNRLDELAILNGMERNTPVAKGMLIKVVGR
ncbi:MAG TPA: M48 family metalloprotease [Saprospiraceae bacterium]|nr:M48 family metalloprotease [Saprospiraceae bacterium]HMP23421.1 M48 family metalloprotease [Saprospiraceae bacterium]